MMKNINDNIILKIIKKVRLKTLIILIVLLSFNSYAWFIYATKVSGGFTARVSSWNVKFQVGTEEITTNVVFDVERIYPGMEPQTKTLTAYNTGEMIAELSYTIKSLRILDKTYTVSEELTSDDILSLIKTDFPFTIDFFIDNSNLNAENGNANFVMTVVWPFESGNDELDTEYGNLAYAHSINYPEESSIHIELELKATQKMMQEE